LNLALKKAAAAHQTALANLMEIKNSVKIEQIKQAEEQLAQARIALASSLNDYNYKKDLYKKMIELNRSGSISEQNRKDTKNQYDAAENLFLESERRVKIAEYNLALLKKGSSEHLIKAAEASVEQAAAAVDEIAHDIEKASIASPIDGIILSKNFEPGSFVQPGALLFEIGDTSSAHIRADVLTDDIAKIAIGRTAYIAGDILAKDSIEAKVSYIAPKAFTKVSSLGVEQQKIEVRLKYDKAGHDFRPGYEFDVNIVSRNKKNALYVPYKAVFEFDGRASMFLIENERLVLREAVTGIENDEYIEILSGAAENEIVIIDPPNSVKPGMKIKK
ncbi:MAG TPA: efflux RND transporter periplasmic adaptor subunit, partial [Candidatus Wallbacteria bacterium]|nr:efflux RND transporter periplasmic adaptor subunit [Candidatus Wallbacteria bacterium]